MEKPKIEVRRVRDDAVVLTIACKLTEPLPNRRELLTRVARSLGVTEPELYIDDFDVADQLEAYARG